MAKATPPAREPGKGERTRARILATALRLFQRRGWERTTMRAIADEAGVSLGNAYYYFESKEHLVQCFYALLHAEHRQACEPLFARARGLRERIEGVLLAKLDTAEPYHRISAALFKSAADPESPLNPFSAATQDVRRDSTALWRRAVDESDARLPADLRERLPELLWLYEMSVVLFWIHDRSSGRARTRRLVARTSELVARLVGIAGFPLLRPLRRSALELVDELKAEAP